MMNNHWPLALVTAAIVAAPAAAAAQGPPPSANYWVYVGAESADLLHLVRFGPGGAEVEKTFIVGEMQVETEGPHGLRTSRDGRYLYMTTGHGIPDGKLWKIETVYPPGSSPIRAFVVEDPGGYTVEFFQWR